jgi:hypothetical protein
MIMEPSPNKALVTAIDRPIEFLKIMPWRVQGRRW